MLKTENLMNEYKLILNERFERSVVSFLNSKTGGRIFIGVRDDGTVVGVENPDEVQMKISDRIKYNILAFLFADQNDVSIKIAKYSGTDKIDLIENEEYGYCSILKSCDRVLDKLAIENRTFTKITAKDRFERKLFDSIAMREAVINAFVHNDYTDLMSPVFEIFSDRLEITSYGGLIDGMTQEELFEGCSRPRNREIMRIFKDVDKVEQLGSGMKRILKCIRQF